MQMIFRKLNKELNIHTLQQAHPIGTQVLVYSESLHPGESKKFASHWRGPMKILKHIGLTGYLVQDMESRKQKVVHASHVKPLRLEFRPK